jgi:hypothetical protein
MSAKLLTGQRCKICPRKASASVCGELIPILNGPEMKIDAHHGGGLSGLPATMARKTEEVRPPLECSFSLTAKAICLEIRSEVLATQSSDKEFDRLTRTLAAEPVEMVIGVQECFHAEHGWAV